MVTVEVNSLGLLLRYSGALVRSLITYRSLVTLRQAIVSTFLVTQPSFLPTMYGLPKLHFLYR